MGREDRGGGKSFLVVVVVVIAGASVGAPERGPLLSNCYDWSSTFIFTLFSPRLYLNSFSSPFISRGARVAGGVGGDWGGGLNLARTSVSRICRSTHLESVNGFRSVSRGVLAFTVFYAS